MPNPPTGTFGGLLLCIVLILSAILLGVSVHGTVTWEAVDAVLMLLAGILMLAGR